MRIEALYSISSQTFLAQLSTFFLLPRPLNGLITALSVGIGALTADQGLVWPAILLAALSAALINGAGNAFNDLLDIDIDRINRPLRPFAFRPPQPERGPHAKCASRFSWLCVRVLAQPLAWIDRLSRCCLARRL